MHRYKSLRQTSFHTHDLESIFCISPFTSLWIFMKPFNWKIEITLRIVIRSYTMNQKFRSIKKHMRKLDFFMEVKICNLLKLYTHNYISWEKMYIICNIFTYKYLIQIWSKHQNPELMNRALQEEGGRPGAIPFVAYITASFHHFHFLSLSLNFRFICD